MIELTVIIPIDSFNEEGKEYLDRNLDSIFSQTVKPSKIHFLVSFDKFDVWDKYLQKTKDEFKIINVEVDETINTDGKTMQELINETVEKEGMTKYFTVSNFKDYFENKNYFNWVEKYFIEEFESSALVPVVKVFSEDEKFLRYDNVQWLADSFSEETSVIDTEGLKLMWEMVANGTVFKTADFLKVGGLKKNFVEFYWYEFFLRFSENKKRAFVIPKSAYVFMETPYKMDNDKLNFYYKSALTEYLFKNDRELKINKNE
jgi:hypothetical protein